MPLPDGGKIIQFSIENGTSGSKIIIVLSDQGNIYKRRISVNVNFREKGRWHSINNDEMFS